MDEKPEARRVLTPAETSEVGRRWAEKGPEACTCGKAFQVIIMEPDRTCPIHGFLFQEEPQT